MIRLASPGRHRGAKRDRQVAGRDARGEADRAARVMAAARLAIVVGQLVWAIARDHVPGGCPGRIL